MEYELYHHGILGMKWGVRRFQNEDGTLTSAGKKRKAEKFNAGIKVLNAAGSAVPNASSVTKGAYGLKRASRSYDLSNMSDADLQKAINRMSLEQSYKNLKNSDINNGESKVNAWLGITGGVVGIASSAATIGYIIWKMANKE